MKNTNNSDYYVRMYLNAMTDIVIEWKEYCSEHTCIWYATNIEFGTLLEKYKENVIINNYKIIELYSDCIENYRIMSDCIDALHRWDNSNQAEKYLIIESIKNNNAQLKLFYTGGLK